MRISPIRLLILLGIALILVVSIYPTPGAAQPPATEEYFNTTGHTIKGAFYQKYTQVQNPESVYGYPLTNEFAKGQGEIVQYMQRAVFRRPTNSDVVTIDKIGAELYAVSKAQPLAGGDLPRNHPACLAVDETSPLVCYAFKDFYLLNGGRERFGLPLSPIVIVNGRKMQYFEYARFEWHPELPSGIRVKLSELGYITFLHRQENPELMAPTPPAIATRPQSLQLAASPTIGTFKLGAEQSVYVLVRDQTLQAVDEAQVTITFTYPSGAKVIKDGFTNQFGMLYVYPNPEKAEKGRVQVEIVVTVNGGDLTGTTRTSYTVW